MASRLLSKGGLMIIEILLSFGVLCLTATMCSLTSGGFVWEVIEPALLSGVLLILAMLIFLSGYGKSFIKIFSSTKTINKTELPELFIMIFVKFRPALMGILIKLILVPFSKKKNDDSMNQTSKEAPFDVLSSCEKEVARLAARGYSNVQIAEELFISVETVKRHMATIFKKLKIESRRELKDLQA